MEPLTDVAGMPAPVALVLSGGASLGALQVGQLRALAEAGLAPDLIVGTSVGAINGLFMAQGFTRDRVEALASVWCALRKQDVFGALGLSSALRLARGGQTLATSARLEHLLRRELPASQAELTVHAHVVAVDYLTGEAVLLGDGNPRRNALASAAIPNVFPAVDINGRLLVDGGISANVPVLPAARLGARTIIVLDTGYPCALARPPAGIVAGILHTMTLTLRSQVHSALPALARDHFVVYLPAPCPLSTGLHDFSRTPELISTGYELARAFLRNLEVRGPGVHGHPHFHQETEA
ncbi:MAG: patatin-like phospholipase family protein [Candidatus Schekmanbacteria bacterium]|nr:patatin-like phospholipase family protein [Candidatus Schekmanbacteria bacterium]